MLKFTYIENDLNIEHLTDSLEDWVMTRVRLALCSGTSLYIEPTSASFLLPKDLSHLSDLEMLLDNCENIEVAIADCENLEVSINGTWVTSDTMSDEGIFLSQMSDWAELLLYKIWRAAQINVSILMD